jgi:hypothetical protein
MWRKAPPPRLRQEYYEFKTSLGCIARKTSTYSIYQPPVSENKTKIKKQKQNGTVI